MSLSAGHWEIERGGKYYYCMVSGGYVMTGIRSSDPKTGFQLSETQNTPLETFSNSNVAKFISQNLNEKTMNDVQEKVNQLIAQRNKKTAAPAKES